MPARRYKGNMNGEQYLGNTAKNQLHDLKAAHDDGYGDCDYCGPKK